MNKPEFNMIVGIPGVGKSTYADAYRKKENYVVLSADKLREELWGSESVQYNPSEVFMLMKERSIEALGKGLNVLFDSTNLERKYRKETLKSLPDYVTKTAVILWAPLEVCVQRDAHRNRVVGEDVIKHMMSKWETPYYDEGWDNIYCYYTYNNDPSAYRKTLLSAMDIPQDNPHHTLSCLKHCEATLEAYKRIYEEKKGRAPSHVNCEAALFHDVGKPFTKTIDEFCDNKVAHYRNHPNVGAFMMIGILQGYSERDVIYALWLVNSHMAPVINKKYYNSLPAYLKEEVDILHEADTEAH